MIDDHANHVDHDDPLSILKRYHMDRLNRQETCLTRFISRYCRNAISLSSVEEVNAEWAKLTKVDISPNVPNTLGVIALQPLDNGVRIGAYAGYLIDPDQCLESPYAIDTAVQVRKHNVLQLVGYPSATASIINCRKDTMYKKPNCEFIIGRGSISLTSKRKITVHNTNVIYIKTCAKIEKGEELLLSYGRDFWKTMVRSCVYCCKKINIDQDRFVKCESLNCQTILHRNCIRKLDLNYTQNPNGWHCLPCIMKEKIGLKRKRNESSQSPPPAQQSPTVLRAIPVVCEETPDEKLSPPSPPSPLSAEEFCELLNKFGNDYEAKCAQLQRLFKLVQALDETKNKMELEIQSLNEQINDKKEMDQTIQKEIQYDKQCLKKIKHSLQVRVLHICTTNFEILPRGNDIIHTLYRDNRSKNNLANNVERLIDSVGNMELKPIYNDGSTNHPRTRGMYSSPDPNQVESIPSTINDAYAEAQPASIDDMLEQLIKEELGTYRMNESSVFLDIGSGYGNCVIHAIVRFRISEGIGIEPIVTRVTNANLCLKNYRLKYRYLKERLDRVRFIHGDATDVNNEMVNNAIEKATHIYCFDEAFADDTRKRILRQLLRYTSLKIFMTRTDPLTMGGYLAEIMQQPNRMKSCFTFSAATNATPRETYKMYAYMIL